MHQNTFEGIFQHSIKQTHGQKSSEKVPRQHYAFLPLKNFRNMIDFAPKSSRVFHSTQGKGLACSIQPLCFCAQSTLLQDSCISVWPLYTLPAKASNINQQNALQTARPSFIQFIYFWVRNKQEAGKNGAEVKDITSSTSMSISSHFNALTITSNFTW